MIDGTVLGAPEKSVEGGEEEGGGGGCGGGGDREGKDEGGEGMGAVKVGVEK